MNNSKNWNDRADRDLFFTILSIKQIGVISGSEWTNIGNHMRSLGYGFTNEGCRQHFQGLRRAQNKAEAKAEAETHGSSVIESAARRSDPSFNPITRRPGPGRGRPRKLPGSGVGGDDSSPDFEDQKPLPDELSEPAAPSVIPAPVVGPGSGAPLAVMHEALATMPGAVPGPVPGALSDALAGGLPAALSGPVSEAEPVPPPESLALDGHADELEEPDPKRPRIDPNTDPSLEDAVLGLAQHNNATPVDQYENEFYSA